MKEFVSNETAYLPAGYPVLSLIETDIIEPEILIRRIADELWDAYEDRFSGDIPAVFYKLRYTPPYGEFRDIRKLILQIRKATGIRSDFKGLIALDVSEYRGHEDEEYFTIFLKYLYDNSIDRRILFVCSQYTEPEVTRLYNACVRYFPIQKEKLMVYSGKMLSDLIKTAFSRQHIEITLGGITRLATYLQSQEIFPHRSIQLIERLPHEILQANPDITRRNVVDEKNIVEYFRKSDSSICMMIGHSLFSERNPDYEYLL